MVLQKRLSDCATRVNTALHQFIAELPLQHSQLVQAMRYAVLAGGKRLRPFLVYATGGMFTLPDHSLDAAAAAVECIHAYSLIHDDLPAMDNDDLRRGQPTCHKKFGEAIAILAGDALQTLAFRILSDAPMPGISSQSRLTMVAQLAHASGVAGMCGGQALDLAAQGNTIALSQLELVHHYKTGALIRAAVHLGALAAGKAADKALPLLDQYAQHIGLAFQVQDDILDVTGDTATLGKRNGADEKLNKSTYPALLGLAAAQEKARHLCHKAQSALQDLEKQGLDTSLLAALANYIIQRNN